jgi:hypothetical protein
MTEHVLLVNLILAVTAPINTDPVHVEAILDTYLNDLRANRPEWTTGAILVNTSGPVPRA